jgi:hypothetical protein
MIRFATKAIRWGVRSLIQAKIPALISTGVSNYNFFLTGAFSKAINTPLMETKTYQKLLGKSQIALGVILSLAFYAFMSVTLVPYTFSPDPKIAQLQACFAAVPVSTTFWFAVNMFMIVLADQRKQKQAAN